MRKKPPMRSGETLVVGQKSKPLKLRTLRCLTTCTCFSCRRCIFYRTGLRIWAVLSKLLIISGTTLLDVVIIAITIFYVDVELMRLQLNNYIWAHKMCFPVDFPDVYESKKLRRRARSSFLSEI